jgi:hypothetical protein
VALTGDEQKLLDELTAKASAPDADDEWELEIFDGAKGARLPISKAAGWLHQNFGIGDAPASPSPAAGAAGDAGQGQGDGGQGQAGGGQAGAARKSYFGKKAAGQ